MRWNEYEVSFRVPPDVRRQKALGAPGQYDVWAGTDAMEEERIGSVYRVRGGWAYGLEDSGHRSGGGGGFTREDAARDLLVLWLRDQGLIGEPERPADPDAAPSAPRI